MLNRNAMVRMRIENAHGLMLSMSADTPTNGKSHVPSLEKFQSAKVPTPPDLKNTTKPRNSRRTPTRIASFLFMALRFDFCAYLKFYVVSRIILQHNRALNGANSGRTVSRRIK